MEKNRKIRLLYHWEQCNGIPTPSSSKQVSEAMSMHAPINSRLNVVVRSPTLFWLGRNGCWPSQGSQFPRALPLPPSFGRDRVTTTVACTQPGFL